MVTASLNMLSPNIKEYRVSSAFISLNVASTDTGSVADIRIPNAKHYFMVNRVIKAVYANPHRMKDVTIIAIPVPTNAYTKILPKFMKNVFFFRL